MDQLHENVTIEPKGEGTIYRTQRKPPIVGSKMTKTKRLCNI